jgi:nucleoside-diphosphate-sugar epimerase
MQGSEDPAVQKAATAIGPDFIYSNPSIAALTEAISGLLHPDGASRSNPAERKVAAINAMVDKYIPLLVSPRTGHQEPGERPRVALLTGTTGALGSHLLAILLEDPTVSRVYAFNRKSQGHTLLERQGESLADKGYPVELMSSKKLVLVEGDAGKEQLGLSGEMFQEVSQSTAILARNFLVDITSQIAESVTLIVHNAWRLDFNIPLSSFEDHVRATCNLLSLGLASPSLDAVRFVFTSSITVGQSWDKKRGPFPEETPETPAESIGTGYGESKYVAERVSGSCVIHRNIR